MGETVRRRTGFRAGERLNVRAHQRVWQQMRLGKLLVVQDQIGKRILGCPSNWIARERTGVSG